MTADGGIHAVTGRSSAHVDSVRAAIVVGCFLVALALLLGPASNLVGVPAPPVTHHHHHLPPVVKGDVVVQVANGTTTPGLAYSWQHPLKLLNWDALPPVDATSHPAHTVIYFAPHEQQAAKLLAVELHVPTQYVVLRTNSTGVAGALNDDVVIVIGADHRGEGIRSV